MASAADEDDDALNDRPATTEAGAASTSANATDERANKRTKPNHREGRGKWKGKNSEGPDGQPRERRKFDYRKDLNKGGNVRHDRPRPEGEEEASTKGAEPATAAPAAPSAAGEGGEDNGPRLPKRKVAVYFGYCGIGYSGLQINPGVKTIEGDIFDTFCSLGAVSEDNAVNPTKVGLQRAARTDRGVHAAGNLMSLKLILEPPGIAGPDELVARINEKLPEYVRIWGLTRVQNGFDARTSCDSRMYEYLLPTYVFLPPKPGSAMYDMLKKMRDDGTYGGSGGEDGGPLQSSSGEQVPGWSAVLDHPFWAKQGTTHTFTEDLQEKKKWRLPAEQLERIRAIFKHYEGSHNFHNFTVGKEFRDRSAQRFMKRLTIEEPMMIGDTEWISVKLHGQSFMLHQIVSDASPRRPT